MDTLFAFFAYILYLVIVLMPVAVPGPIASLLFVSYAKKKNLSAVHLVLLVIADGLSMLFIIVSDYSRISDLVFCLTPMAFIASLIILGLSRMTLSQIGTADAEFQKKMDAGIGLIFFLEIIIFLIAAFGTTE